MKIGQERLPSLLIDRLRCKRPWRGWISPLRRT